MSDTARAIAIECEIDAIPPGPLCPRHTCREPMVKASGQWANGDVIYHGAAWLCHNTPAHANRPDTAALYFDWELIGPPMSPAEVDVLETIVDTTTGRVVGR